MSTARTGRRRAGRHRARRPLGNAVLALSFAALLVLGIGPRTGQYQTMTVLTASMAPDIPAGSVVVIRPVDRADLRVGDVITYRIPVQDRRVVTHRIVELAGDRAAPTVRTKGDALEEPDAWTTRFTEGQVWRVQATVPYAGRAIRALRHPAVRIATVGVAPLLLAGVFLVGIWRPRRPDDEPDGGHDDAARGVAHGSAPTVLTALTAPSAPSELTALTALSALSALAGTQAAPDA